MRTAKSIRLGLASGILVSAMFSSGCLHDPVAERQEARREAFDLLTQGQQLKEQGDFILARDVFLEALQVSERPVLYYEIGNCHYQLGNYEQALDYYDRALALAPDYTLAQSERDLVAQKLEMQQPETESRVAGAVSQPEPARKAEQVEAAVEGEEDSGPVAISEEVEAVPAAVETEESEQDAEPEAQETAEAQPRQPESGPFSGLTQAFAGLSGEQSAASSGSLEQIDEQEARRVLFPELNPETKLSPEEQRQAAEAASAFGRFDEAVRRWTRVLGDQPGDVEARLELAEALYRSGRTRRAEEEYLRATTLAPDNPEVHFQAANFYVRAGEPSRAKAAFDRALELEPGHLRARNNLAALHLQSGNPELATAQLEQVLQADPLFTSAWLNMALALDDAGARPEEVLDALETYRRLSESTDPQSEKWLRDLRRRVQASPTEL